MASHFILEIDYDIKNVTYALEEFYFLKTSRTGSRIKEHFLKTSRTGSRIKKGFSQKPFNTNGFSILFF